LLGWLFGERDENTSVCVGTNTLTLKASADTADDDKPVTDAQTLKGIVNYGTITVGSGDGLLVDSSGMTAFAYSEDADDSLGNTQMTESGSIVAEVRLFGGCSSALNCNSAPIFAASATKVTLQKVDIVTRESTFAVDDDKNVFNIKLVSEAYARWFFPNLKAGTYAVGLFLTMDAQAEVQADATVEVEVMFGDHILDVKRVKFAGGCALVESTTL
jgi:hypothetical protein